MGTGKGNRGLRSAFLYFLQKFPHLSVDDAVCGSGTRIGAETSDEEAEAGAGNAV